MRQSLIAGLERMKEIGGAKPGDRTMLDALQPALAALENGFEAAARAARAGANHTATLTRTNAGRASCIDAEQLHGHVDPGAEALARLFANLAVRRGQPGHEGLALRRCRGHAERRDPCLRPLR